MTTKARLDFCDALRGAAAVLVVISHLVGVFWSSQTSLEKLLGYASLGEVNLPYAYFIIKNKLFFGQLGVALFFLISGFVISVSLSKFNGAGFLVNRVIRIYPVYIAGFGFLVLGLMLVADSNELPYKPLHLVVHSLILLRQWLGYDRIDGISWTLEIEMYFYALMYVFFKFKEDNRIFVGYYIFLTLILVANLIGKYDWYIGRQLLIISYMMVGVFFYYYHIKKISKRKLFVLTFFGVIGVLCYFIRIKPLSFGYFPGYIVAPIIFYFLYQKREKYKIGAIPKFFGLISYPLYAVHSIFGYALMAYLLRHGLNSWASLVLTLTTVILLSYLVHVFVEKPSIRLSRKFNR